MAEKPAPRFHPISYLPTVRDLVDGQLEGAEEQYRLLLQARPGSLDDATVARVVRVFAEEMEFLDIYDEQLARWRRGTLTPAQRREVERLGGQVARNRVVATAILELAEDLKAVTIDAILAKDDLELGLEQLAGLFPPPRRHHPPPR